MAGVGDSFVPKKYHCGGTTVPLWRNFCSTAVVLLMDCEPFPVFLVAVADAGEDASDEESSAPMKDVVDWRTHTHELY